MGALCADGTPKALLKVNGKPIIRHVVDYWKNHVEWLQIVVMAGTADAFCDVLDDVNVDFQVIEQPFSVGPADAILWALESAHCPRRFMVALGDCLCDGTFDFDGLVDWNGVAVRKDDASEWGRSYSVGIYDDVSGVQVGANVRSVIEKPALGLGYYWFNWLALSALERHRCGTMTDVMGQLVADGHLVRPVWYEGEYRNVTYPEDLAGWTT